MKKQTYSSLILFFISLINIKISLESFRSNPKNNEKCYVLALEGGGDKGAYQAGAIKGLINKLEKEKRSYDVVTGISVGSINAGAFSVFKKGDEAEAIDFLLKGWRSIKGNSDIYENWTFGIIQGLISKNSLFDSSPLKNLLERILKGKQIKRKFVVGAVNGRNGEYQTWDEEEIKTTDELINVIRASSAIPVIFLSIEQKGEYYMDGGVVNSIDIFSGINRCQDMGFDQKNIVVDIVRCKTNKEIEDVDISKYNALEMLGRYISISTKDFFMKTIDEVYNNFPEVDFRYLIKPEKHLPNTTPPLNFSKEVIEKLIALGIEDGENVVTRNGKSGNIKKEISFYLENQMLNYQSKKKNKKTIEYLS